MDLTTFKGSGGAPGANAFPKDCPQGTTVKGVIMRIGDMFERDSYDGNDRETTMWIAVSPDGSEDENTWDHFWLRLKVNDRPFPDARAEAVIDACLAAGVKAPSVGDTIAVQKGPKKLTKKGREMNTFVAQLAPAPKVATGIADLIADTPKPAADSLL